MKNVILSMIFCLILLISGCKQIIFRKYGMHEPREETPESLKSFLKEKGYPQQHHYYFSDTTAYLSYLADSLAHKQIISTSVYNWNGLLNNILDPKKCQWSGGYYASSLKTDTIYSVDSTRKIQTLLRQLKPLYEENHEMIDPDSVDFIVVVTWGAFLGQYNERQFIVEQRAKENKKAKVAVIFLNVEAQKDWHLSEESQIKIK